MNPGVDLNIDPKVWRKFKKLAIDEGRSASRIVEEFMEDRIAESKEKY